MLSRVQNFSEDGRQMVLWQELGEGAPTVVAFARLCSEAIVTSHSQRSTPRPGDAKRENPESPVFPADPAETPGDLLESLDEEARAILYLARHRGTIEVKAVNHAFESSERFLTVCVELDMERTFILKRRDDPELTVRFLDGFRQLCVSGLVMHHIFRDFSLTRRGFELARTVPREQVSILLPLAEEQVIGDY
jgi:hypothetical protein